MFSDDVTGVVDCFSVLLEKDFDLSRLRLQTGAEASGSKSRGTFIFGHFCCKVKKYLMEKLQRQADCESDNVQQFIGVEN